MANINGGAIPVRRCVMGLRQEGIKFWQFINRFLFTEYAGQNPQVLYNATVQVFEECNREIIELISGSSMLFAGAGSVNFDMQALNIEVSTLPVWTNMANIQSFNSKQARDTFAAVLHDYAINMVIFFQEDFGISVASYYLMDGVAEDYLVFSEYIEG